MVGVSFQPLLAYGAAAALTSITQVLSATSTASTINFPGGIQAGDLIAMFDAAVDDTAIPSTVTPTGFTSINNVNFGDGVSTFLRSICSYKLAAGTESGSLTGMNGNLTNTKAMLVFRGNIAATTLTTGSVNGQAIGGNPSAQNCAASAGVAPLVVFGAYRSDGVVNPRTFSTTKDGEINPTTQMYFAWKIYNSSPADSSIDMDDEGNANSLQSFYIQMA